MSTQKRRSSLTAGEFLMFLAGGMFCLILITTAMMGSLLARYTTGNEGTDSARVAKWDVGAMLSPAPAEGETRSQVDVVYVDKVDKSKVTDSGVFTLTFTSDSEVAVQYDIKVNFGSELPKGITAVLKKPDGTERAPDEPMEPQVLSYTKVGSFPAGGGTAVYELEFTVDWLVIDFAADNKDGKPEEETIDLDFDVNVTMYQID